MEPEPTDRRVSVRDMAKQLGVSHSAVSLALRNSTQVSEKLRENVRQLAEELGYQPDPMLSALSNYRRGKSAKSAQSVIAWINTWKKPAQLRESGESDAYWTGASQAARKLGYRLEEIRMGGGVTPQRLHQILSARGIRAILLPPHAKEPDWGDFPWRNYFVVRFGRPPHAPLTHFVTADQTENTAMAFEKILERGYRRIGFVTREAHMRVKGHLSEAGYLIAQCMVDEELRLPVCSVFGTKGAEREKLLAAWVKHHRPDAIFTDVPALPGLLEKIGLRVPEDVAVAAATVLDSGIDAGINPQSEEIGRVAVLLLSSLIQDAAPGLPPICRQMLVEGSWVDGTSLPDRSGRPIAV
jgi:DNA-binding LacI/PurR family transcriptional regulator